MVNHVARCARFTRGAILLCHKSIQITKVPDVLTFPTGVMIVSRLPDLLGTIVADGKMVNQEQHVKVLYTDKKRDMGKLRNYISRDGWSQKKREILFNAIETCGLPIHTSASPPLYHSKIQTSKFCLCSSVFAMFQKSWKMT